MRSSKKVSVHLRVSLALLARKTPPLAMGHAEQSLAEAARERTEAMYACDVRLLLLLSAVDDYMKQFSSDHICWT